MQVLIIEWIRLVRTGCHRFQPKCSQLPSEVTHGTSLLSQWRAAFQVARFFSCVHSIWVVPFSNMVSAGFICFHCSLMNVPCMAAGGLLCTWRWNYYTSGETKCDKTVVSASACICIISKLYKWMNNIHTKLYRALPTQWKSHYMA